MLRCEKLEEFINAYCGRKQETSALKKSQKLQLKIIWTEENHRNDSKIPRRANIKFGRYFDVDLTK